MSHLVTMLLLLLMMMMMMMMMMMTLIKTRHIIDLIDGKTFFYVLKRSLNVFERFCYKKTSGPSTIRSSILMIFCAVWYTLFGLSITHSN